MGKNTGIEWAHHTFNPWIGCTKVSPACDHCYAEDWANRYGRVTWGPHGDRSRTKTWGNPVKWNKALEGTGRRERVFCASLADVFDNHKSIQQEWRDDLWALMCATPNLDWLLLTKRPQNIAKFVPTSWMDEGFPENVWLGATVENQTEAERRIPRLLRVPCALRFLSCEPLLGGIDFNALTDGPENINAITGLRENPFGDIVTRGFGPKIGWVITGCESGPNYRPADPDWFRSLRDQCKAAGVPFLFKQWEGKTQAQIKKMGRELDGVIHDGYPEMEGGA